MKAKPDISRIAFWDVDFDKIDFEEKSTWVIGKVLNYGSWKDILSLIQFYGQKRIKNEIINVPYLDNRVIDFWANYFKLDKKEFKCYIKKRSAPVPWLF